MWTWATRPWGRAIAVITTVVVATTPGLAIGATAVQVSAGGASVVTVEQTGPREVTVTNTGERDARFAGTSLRRHARMLKLDATSPCLALRMLSAGASCVLRQDHRGAATPAQAPRLKVAVGSDRTLSLTNAGAKDLRLGGRAAAPWFRLAGIRSGTCLGASALAAGATCTLAPGTKAASLRGAPRSLTGFAAASPQAELERDIRMALGAVAGGLIWLALLPVLVVVGYPLLAVWTILGLTGLLVCGFQPCPSLS